MSASGPREEEKVALAPLELEAFGLHFFPKQPKGPLVRGLHRLLITASEEAPLADRLLFIEQLSDWLRPRVKLLPGLGAAAETARTGRLRILVQVLRQTPAWRERIGRLVRSVLAETSGYGLFCQTGLPGEPGFLFEAADRIARKLLPAPPDDGDLAELLGRILHSEADAEWLKQVPPELLAELGALFRDPRAPELDPFAHVRAEMADAMAVIATRVASLGLADDVRTRSPAATVRESPFLRLPRACDALLASREEAPRQACLSTIGECRRTVKAVLGRLEQAGVSVDLVYRLELITKNLDRLEELLELLCPPAARASDHVAGARQTARLLAELVQDRIADRSLTGLIHSNARQLARKVIERAGDSGEHYITTSRAEYHRMITSAGGGGFLTAGTAALKFAIGWGAFPFFFELLFSSLNYAGSFVLMQLLGFTLATKQPSMTAAALAGSLKAASGTQELGPLVDLIARITRSQLAAAIGNLGMVIPAAVGVHFLVRWLAGTSFLDEKTALYVVHSLHPGQSLVILWAALTGCALWLSSVAAGWVENWAVYRRLPEAIALHRRLHRLLGSARSARLSRAFLHNISGVSGSITLGILLAAIPVLGKFFGVPLAVAHVTLSTGALVLAGCALGPERLWDAGVAGASLGIVLVGILNFGVSFALALSVALRARDVNNQEKLRLVRAVLQRALRAPLDFLRPPREEPALPAPVAELAPAAAPREPHG